VNAVWVAAGRLACAAAIWIAGFGPLLAQTVIYVGEDPFAVGPDAPWGLPEELTAGLAQRTSQYEEWADDLECSETTQRVKYPRGSAAAGAVRESTYVFALDAGAMVPVPTKDHGKSWRRYGKSDAPRAHAWLQLFAEDNQPFFAYRDLGEVPHAFGNARRIQFRGSLPYTDGRDIRQWEGTVLIDPHSLELLELDARPLHLWPRLERQRREYVNSFKFLFLRFKKKPIAERVHVRFDSQPSGMTLPVDADVERLELIAPDQAIVRSRLLTQYDYEFRAR
jgi:hypothetical protein